MVGLLLRDCGKETAAVSYLDDYFAFLTCILRKRVPVGEKLFWPFLVDPWLKGFKAIFRPNNNVPRFFEIADHFVLGIYFPTIWEYGLDPN